MCKTLILPKSKVKYWEFKHELSGLIHQTWCLYVWYTILAHQTHEMLKVDKKKASFPLLLSFNFAVTTPLMDESEALDSSDNEEEEQVENINWVFIESKSRFLFIFDIMWN